MSFKIENAKTEFFTSKQHYLNFRAAWSETMNSENKHKVRASHMMMYNLLRGKEMTTGFTPATNKNKLTNGCYINGGLYFANYQLRKVKLDGPVCQLYYLDVFNGTTFQDIINEEMLLKLQRMIPVVDPVDPNYGKGTKVAEKIISGELSSQDVWAYLEEAA